MDKNIDFICGGESPEQIPDFILNRTGFTIQQAHTDRNAMAAISEELRSHEKDSICRVPFCVAVEAEAMGAEVKIWDNLIGAKVEGFRYSKIEEIKSIEGFDLDRGMIKEVLESVEILSKNGNVVSLNVEGPFTILALLIDSMSIYKGLKSNREIIDEALKKIEDSIVRYILAGLEKGAKIISYADPSGDISLLGPKLYKEMSGKYSHNILKRIEGHLKDSIVHLCGKTSIAFENTGFSEASPVEISNPGTYGEVICQLLRDENIKFLGHKCMKSTPLKMKNPVVWKITLQ